MTHFHNCVMDLSFHERQVTLRKLRLKLNVNTNITY